MRNDPRGEAGVTLVEVLMTIVIIGIATTALLGGVMTMAITSRDHTDLARAQAVLTSAAERLRDPDVLHVACATPTTATYLAAVRAADVPSSWTASSAVTITQVRYWDGTTFGTTCYDDTAHQHLLQLQLVTVQVTAPGGDSVQSVSVVKEADT